MIRTATLHDVQAISRIHRNELEGDFLPSLGINFLEEFYRILVKNPKIKTFVVYDKSEIKGFIVGTVDTNSVFSSIKSKKGIKLGVYLLIALVNKPLIVKNILQTLFYKGINFPVKAELVVIAVKKNFQNKGLGRKLINNLEVYFRSKGIREYKLTVKQDKKALKIYDHLGYKRRSSFSLYGSKWYLLTKKI